MTAVSSRAGRNSGKVTRQKRCQAPAPSSSAASIRDCGTDCRPASMMIITVPRLRHTAITIMTGRANRVSASHAGPSIPNQPRTVFTNPACGSSSVFHTTATATTLVITGR
ncbi:hypothetical protein SALBM311S_06938 [Streptomyces alboniger]